MSLIFSSSSVLLFLLHSLHLLFYPQSIHFKYVFFLITSRSPCSIIPVTLLSSLLQTRHLLFLTTHSTLLVYTSSTVVLFLILVPSSLLSQSSSYMLDYFPYYIFVTPFFLFDSSFVPYTFIFPPFHSSFHLIYVHPSLYFFLHTGYFLSFDTSSSLPHPLNFHIFSYTLLSFFSYYFFATPSNTSLSPP